MRSGTHAYDVYNIIIFVFIVATKYCYVDAPRYILFLFFVDACHLDDDNITVYVRRGGGGHLKDLEK